jgi:soluble lytic murein transglycosylase
MARQWHPEWQAVAGATVAALIAASSPAARANQPQAGPTVATPAAAAATQPADPAETRYYKRLDAAIAAAISLAVTAADAQRLREVAQALAANDPAKGQQRLAEIESPIVRKVGTWLRLRAGLGTSGECRTFLANNPGWPDRPLLIQRCEEALFTEGGTAKSIRAAFEGREPQTGAGHAALASALLAEGDNQRAREQAARAWRDLRIAATLETGFLQRFQALLTPADHKWRLDRLLIDDIRWAGERAERAAVARRLVPLLPEGERPKAEARLAVFIKAANAKALIDALPAETATDWGLAYHRIQVLRRAGKLEEAWKLLLASPADPALLVNPDDWWEERRANAYAALEAGQPRKAYQLVATAPGVSVNPLKEQSFMAGWLALRLLKDQDAAHKHFIAARKAADGPLSLARSAYWLGRAEEARGNAAAARGHYADAAKVRDTFHGQLAQARLDGTQSRLEIGLPAEPTRAEAERFVASDAVLGAVAAFKSGLEPAIVRAFLGHLARSAQSEAESAMVAHMAEAFGDTQQAVRIAKLAVGRGHNLLIYGYPIHPFPDYTPLRTPPEKALLLAVARQESEFNMQTVSGAGARGLLQVMPITARHVCKDYKIKCDIPRLLSDRSYNTMMASAYIGDRMGEFQGSYVLSLAGYNAGPGRARQWIRQFGDPRAADVDPIDWIERIPFQETREYVAKVLSNIQVYRARLGDPKPMRIAADLVRAREQAAAPGGEPAGAAVAEPKTAGEPPAAASFEASR